MIKRLTNYFRNQYFSLPTMLVGLLGIFVLSVNFHQELTPSDTDLATRVVRIIVLSAITVFLLIPVELGFRGLKRRPSLRSLVNFADLWGLQLRKKIKALAGDYDAEIARLHKQRRYKTAQWNRILAWGYAIWYVLRGPLDWVTDYLISAVKGR